MDSNNRQLIIAPPPPAKETACDYFFNEFPVGLRVLIIDDDRTCLLVLEKMLQRCLYQVTKCQQGRDALSLLRQDKSRFDIVVSDVHMPDMNGFELLQIIGIEMDLPIIMMSSDDKQEVLLKGILSGACDYLIKPVRMDALKLIWQHVLRKKINALKRPRSIEDGKLCLKESQASDTVSTEKGLVKCLKRRKDDEDAGEAAIDMASGKKRMVWTKELHAKFVCAVEHLGKEKAVPMKILECLRKMNVQGITRENVASHLQKYRTHLRNTDHIPDCPKECFVPSRFCRTSIFEQSSSSDIRRNTELFSNSSQLVTAQSLIRPQSNVPIALIANSSIGMPHNPHWNFLHSGLQESNYCLINKSPTNDFPLTGVDSSCRTISSIATTSSDACGYMTQGNNALDSHQSLSIVDSMDDAMPLLISDPSLYIQFDHAEMLQGPFMRIEKDAAQHGSENDIDWPIER